jgi:hypothetical protein
MATGLFKNQGNWIVSDDVPTIHPNSGLVGVVLGPEAGYRLYFHDEDGVVNELAYANQQWRYRGPISNDIGSLPAIGVAYSGAQNITVATPRDEHNIGVTRWNRDETWNHSTNIHRRHACIMRFQTNTGQQQLYHRRSTVFGPRPKSNEATSL